MRFFTIKLFMKTKTTIQSRLKALYATRLNALKVSFGVALLIGLAGCVGYVDDGYDGGAVVATGPDVWLFGGSYDHVHDVRVYSHRGAVSRGFAHPVGGGHGGHR
jgi:hypothetical protein